MNDYKITLNQLIAFIRNSTIEEKGDIADYFIQRNATLSEDPRHNVNEEILISKWISFQPELAKIFH